MEAVQTSKFERDSGNKVTLKSLGRVKNLLKGSVSNYVCLFGALYDVQEQCRVHKKAEQMHSLV